MMAKAKQVDRHFGHSTAAFARFAAGLDPDAVPDGLRQTMAMALLDSIGVAAAASRLGDGCAVLIDAAADEGAGDSVLFGTGVTASPLAAAFVNGGLVHALNFDGGEPSGVGMMVASALAATDVMATPVSGRSFLAALVAGGELLARLHEVVRESAVPIAGTLDGQLLSYAGCAVAAARVMGLSAEGIGDAIGLAFMQAAGSMQIVFDGEPPAKAVYGAFPARAGLHAALLARRGLGAACDAFDGEAGLFAAHYADRGALRLDCDQLGSRWVLADFRFKPWPTSLLLHAFIEAAIALRRSGRITGEIVGVRLVADPSLRAWFEPAEARRAPENAAAAANSGSFSVAAALATGRVDLASLTGDGLRDPAVLAVAARTTVAYRAGLGTAATVIVRDAGGTDHAETVAVPAGHASRPLARDPLLEKFRHCLALARQSDLGARAASIIDFVERLEAVDDMRQLSRLLA